MKPKHIILITALLTTALFAFAFIAPATADTTTQIENAVVEIINNDELSPIEKLEEQTKVFGMDLRLKMWLEAPRDEETGEPIYDDYIPVITPVLSFLGLSDAIENPYTQAEGEAAYAAYLDLYLSSYKPTGTFGGPIE